jgi:choice-of-anchor C domain-containing protein
MTGFKPTQVTFMKNGQETGRYGRWAGRIALAGSALSVAVCGISASASATTSPNLIKNGGFRSPVVHCSPGFCEYNAGSTALPHWAIGGNSVDLVSRSVWMPAPGRTQSVDLSGSGSGTLAQSVNTTAGSTYRLKWQIAGNPVCGQAIKTMDIYWNETLVDSVTFDTSGHSRKSMGWTSEQLNVTATGSTSSVEFADVTPDDSVCGAVLDSVVLKAT